MNSSSSRNEGMRKLQGPSSLDSSDNEMAQLKRASKIPRADPKHFSTADRLKKSNNETPRGTATTMSKLKAPKELTKRANTELGLNIPKQKVTSETPRSVRYIEIKLSNAKKDFSKLLQEISRKQSAAIALREEIISNINALNNLTGKHECFEDDIVHNYRKMASSIENLLSELSLESKVKDWSDKLAHKLKDKVCEEDLKAMAIPYTEEDALNTKEKMNVIKNKISAIAFDATERIQTYESLLIEKNKKIHSLKNHLATIKVNRSKSNLAFDDLHLSKLREADAAKEKLEDELSMKTADCKMALEEVASLKLQIENTMKLNNDSILIHNENSNLKNQLKDKTIQLEILTNENALLRTKIAEEILLRSSQHSDESITVSELRHKKIQAELDPKHRSARQQIQILKSEVRRLETTIKKLRATEEPLSLLKRNNGLKQFDILLKQGNLDIRRLETVMTKMKEHQQSALQRTS